MTNVTTYKPHRITHSPRAAYLVHLGLLVRRLEVEVLSVSRNAQCVRQFLAHHQRVAHLLIDTADVIANCVLVCLSV